MWTTDGGLPRWLPTVSTINECGVRTTVKKEKEMCEAVAAAVPADGKPCSFVKHTFSAPFESAAFVWLQDCLRKAHLPALV